MCSKNTSQLEVGRYQKLPRNTWITSKYCFYSMGQIIRSPVSCVCVCLFVCLSVCALIVALLTNFDKFGHRHSEPETKELFRWVYHIPWFPTAPPKMGAEKMFQEKQKGEERKGMRK